MLGEQSSCLVGVFDVVEFEVSKYVGKATMFCPTPRYWLQRGP